MNKRIFAAIKLNFNSEIVENINKLKKNLSSEKIKWVDTSHIHLTLFFFGETSGNKVSQISDLLELVCNKYSSFELKTNTLGVFRNFINPTVLWVGLNKCNELELIYNDLLKKIDTLGYKPDYENFSPHITIGRINFVSNLEKFKKIILSKELCFAQTEKISEIILYESILKPTGAQYIELKKYPLISNY